MEKLTVKNLGPLKDFTMETNRLTVLIGPQASGKSLLAQMLYLFRDYRSLLAERYNSSWSKKDRFGDEVGSLLDELRAAPFDLFCQNDSLMGYADNSNVLRIHMEGTKPTATSLLSGIVFCSLNQELESNIRSLRDEWTENKYSLKHSLSSLEVYIPTERSMYTRLSNGMESALYSSNQPLVLRRFASNIEKCKAVYDRSRLIDLMIKMDEHDAAIHAKKINFLQQRALKGRVEWREDEGDWVWLSPENNSQQEMPLELLSSGQMETWPFFALCYAYGMSSEEVTFYFEEPETHLHPNAQVEVVKTIAYLISRGHRFVITTHSPFILYVINNLIQAHIAYEGNTPEGEFSINPDHVAAYCLGEKPRSIVDDETRLLNLDEIDDVFDDIGEYFQNMLDKAYAKRKKNK